MARTVPLRRHRLPSLFTLQGGLILWLKWQERTVQFRPRLRSLLAGLISLASLNTADVRKKWS
jgi:hypothetical protein